MTFRIWFWRHWNHTHVWCRVYTPRGFRRVEQCALCFRYKVMDEPASTPFDRVTPAIIDELRVRDNPLLRGHP